MTQSDLERTFVTLWRTMYGPDLVDEHRFHQTRRWRFDFAHLETKVAIELDGGTFSGGRHTRGKGYAADCEKLNAATAAGWRVFRLTSDMLAEDPFTHLTQIIETINVIHRSPVESPFA